MTNDGKYITWMTEDGPGISDDVFAASFEDAADQTFRTIQQDNYPSSIDDGETIPLTIVRASDGETQRFEVYADGSVVEMKRLN